MLDVVKQNRKLLLTLFGILAIFSLNAFAGTDDNLGLSGTWDTVQGWISDGYLTKMISGIMLIVTIFMFSKQMVAQGFLFLILIVVITQLDTIIGKLASATF
jgi:hypothetical protein